MSEIIEFIQATGFPIVIALLFYLDLRSIIKRNTKALFLLVNQQEQLFRHFKQRG